MAFKIFFIIFLPCWLFSELGYVTPWGKDCDIEIAKEVAKTAKNPTTSERIILFYQKNITQITGPRSHFRPTSSQYMLQAIREHGFFKGYIMGADRLLRENSEEWVYRKKKFGENLYKWDPP